MAKHLQELQESDVIFPDHVSNDSCCQEMDRRTTRGASYEYCEKKEKRMANSVPVNIPDRYSIFRRTDSDDLEEESDDGEVVPPHVIIGRRIAGKMAFSVCTGNGRTLKGRDLSQVRNSILRMTGFLET
ncbi:protein S40-1-like [Corylus avellana]|uniref:protein S40-1-like n=1 Tax=Corylus avellana TaxID=13451 RepID=UPI00286B7615|nr:protein S40-1-like [Corylus avellana]